MRIYTIGHSTRTLEELVDALRSFGVRTLADIRTVPRSRRVPQFNRESLARTLPERGIRYHHVPALGGLRRPRSDSTNTAWRNANFRGFADYMQTGDFEEGLVELRTLAREGTGMVGVTVDGIRHDAGDKLGYLRANLAYALKRPELRGAVLALCRDLLAEAGD